VLARRSLLRNTDPHVKGEKVSHRADERRSGCAKLELP
jgi:hypothetical protein